METITLDKDIKVLYVPAASFPDGIKEAHDKLHTLVPFSAERRFFGISRPEQGVIKYKAAAEEKEPGEAARLECETMVIKQGEYISMLIHDYMQDLQSIKKAFDQLTSHPGIDPEGYCVEWYMDNKDVKCMIRLRG